MTSREKAEKLLEVLANTEQVEKASKVFHEAWEKACDEASVPAATTAFVMACAAAVSGAPRPLQQVFLQMFADTFNTLEGEERVVTGVMKVEKKAPKGPIGFAQAPAKA